ncbi:guanine deaminase [Limosilactobacillus secaliphilus]|uniref:Guanine deaminase n=1 Tax=Limosilactobacillus secaliphilus TaxID=396268 RepID=A0A0R2I1D4_9LACO|nr:guanine deaminase [Limosilactobacillus secaliphilus]KRN58976.1 guanine deaminase [Limosilactobacillus secaliphilus]
MAELTIHGTYFSSKDPNHVQAVQDALIMIDSKGIIARILHRKDPEYAKQLQVARQQERLVELGADQYLLPGFVDLHVHAPQWPQAGLALDLPLAKWLNHYTFPLEAKLSDPTYAQKVYQDFVHNLLANGTTAALMFGTIHFSANMILAKESVKQGLRGFVGQVVMDNPSTSPEYYRNSSAQAALSSTEKFIHAVRDLQTQSGQTIEPVITPRFVPSCTDEALFGLGRLAHQYDLPVQSHLSESNWEHGYAIERFGQRDTEVMDHFGLLTKRAVMAHGTQLTKDDWRILRERHSAIAHCPISNIYFGNGVLPVKQLLALHNQLGLGSDISGGYTPSLFHNARQAVKSSQQLTDGVDNQLPAEKRGVAGSRITMANAFYLATRGGAAALGLKTGVIQAGYAADLQVVKMHRALMPLSTADIFQRLMYQTEQTDIETVFVNGQPVYQRN